MPSTSPTAFGKRNLPPSPSVRAASPAPIPRAATTGHAAFFVTARREIEDAADHHVVVPRSFRAALLAGLVVGFGLAGLDLTQATAILRQIAGITGVETTRFLPVMIVFALLGGARAAATSLLVAHALLRRAGRTSHLDYAMAGGAVAAIFALVTLASMRAGLIDAGLTPGHGLALDTVAGASAGVLYRVFAGARAA